MPQMTGDDLPEGDVIEKVSKILHIDIVFNNKELKVTIAKDERLKDLKQRAKQICEKSSLMLKR